MHFIRNHVHVHGRQLSGILKYFVVMHSSREKKIKISFSWRKKFLKRNFTQVLVRMVTKWSTRLINTKKVNIPLETEFLRNSKRAFSEK